MFRTPASHSYINYDTSAVEEVFLDGDEIKKLAHFTIDNNIFYVVKLSSFLDRSA
jgi:hypothetical protein